MYLIMLYIQWWIQVLRLGGQTFLGFRIAPPPPPLRGFPEANYKSLYLDFLGFQISPPPPPMRIFPEATMKVYYGGVAW